MMGKAPKFTIEAFEIADSKERTSLGMIDITYCALRVMVGRGRHATRMAVPPRVMDLSGALTDEMRKVGLEGRLALPGFEKHLDDFIDAAGGLERLPALRRHRDAVRQVEYVREDARRIQSAAGKARFDTTTDFGMVCPPCGPREYVSDFDEAHDGWRWDDYVQDHPRPEFGTPAAEAWDKAYAAWVRREAPPFAFGTTEVRWKGPDLERVLGALDDFGTVDLGSLIEVELENHYEEAVDDILGFSEMQAALNDWAAAPTEARDDEAMAALLAEWNAKQKILSYREDRSVITPAFAEVTPIEVAEWCQRHLDRAEAHLEAVENEWSGAAQEPESEASQACEVGV